jgi:hypothetical protein
VTASFTYAVVAIADFALIPAPLALYVALKDVSKSWMLLATAIILTYVAIDISTFVSTAFALVVLAREAQSAAVVSAEHFGAGDVSLSQFIGWVFPGFGFLIIAVVSPPSRLTSLPARSFALVDLRRMARHADTADAEEARCRRPLMTGPQTSPRMLVPAARGWPASRRSSGSKPGAGSRSVPRRLASA